GAGALGGAGAPWGARAPAGAAGGGGAAGVRGKKGLGGLGARHRAAPSFLSPFSSPARPSLAPPQHGQALPRRSMAQPCPAAARPSLAPPQHGPALPRRSMAKPWPVPGTAQPWPALSRSVARADPGGAIGVLEEAQRSHRFLRPDPGWCGAVQIGVEVLDQKFV